MCGLYCNFGPSAKLDLSPDIMDILNRRGPEFTDTFDDGICALLHTRLSIIDLTKSANQPMINEKGQIIIIFNGEIYNYKSLRKELHELSSVTFNTESDTEVIMRGYELFGAQFLSKLEGIFSLIIYQKS